MSTYYEYQDVKRKIAHRLFKLDGWKVYGYKADESDLMTDYYSPAYWDGIATKNGYKLVVDHSSETKDKTETYTRWIKNGTSAETAAKIAKLEQMTQERGASEDEERTAKAKIEKLLAKQEEGKEEYTVFYPGHLANPPRCNWHIEKDGIIIDKGTGLLKFAGVPDISEEKELKEWQEFNNKTAEQWKADFYKWVELHPYYYNNADTEEGRQQIAEYRYQDAKEKYDLLEKFNVLINRINTTCGGMMGNSTEFYTYEEKIVTEYKKEIKAQETATGALKEGQHIIIKSHYFNYGVCAGYVYVIHEKENSKGGKYYIINRLNGKLTKELTGNANPANCLGYFSSGSDINRLNKWIEKGSVAWCELVEVTTPYEVKKVVKKVNKSEKAEEEKEMKKEEQKTAETPTEEKKEEAKQEETKAEESKEENKAETEKENDMFSQLAAAFLNKKTIKSNRKKEEKKAEQPKQEEKKEETKEEQEETPTPEPEKEQPYIFGYDGNNTEFLNDEEIAKLENCEQVNRTKTSKYGEYKEYYITARYNENSVIVYNLPTNRNYDIVAGHGAEYLGFVVNGKFYNDTKNIILKMIQDAEQKLKGICKDEHAAACACANLSELERKNINYYKEHDYTEEARRHFYNNTKPELTLFGGELKGVDTAIKYIINPEAEAEKAALEYLCNYPEKVYISWIRYNRTCEKLAEIKADKSRKEHEIKKIVSAITDQKTVRVIIESGNEIKVEADAIKKLTHWNYINKWDILAQDRPKDENGRERDVQIEEIKEIRHGQKVLYKAA